MDPVTMSLIVAGVGSGIKILGSLFDDTASREADLTRKQADLKQSALEETMRRAEGQQTQVLSSTKARMAATGFASDSKSFTGYLSGMTAEFMKQNTFQQKQGMAAIDLMRQSADIQENAGTMSKIFGALQLGVGSAGAILGMVKPGGGGGDPNDVSAEGLIAARNAPGIMGYT